MPVTVYNYLLPDHTPYSSVTLYM